MRYIYKHYREERPEMFRETFEKRMSGDSVVHTKLTIKPIDQQRVFPLYYVPTKETMQLIADIYKHATTLRMLFEQVPSASQESFLLGCLADEIYNTNTLEGVCSSREAIVRSVKSMRELEGTPVRFGNMIKSYDKILFANQITIKTPRDIRTIYDHLVSDEIDVSEQLDGQLFRKDTTYVLKRSGSGKVTHRGIVPEERIVDGLEEMITFLH
ncbi:MAG: hypothetical protein ACRC5C_12970, partial [Bacilli bacterium]